MSGPSSAPVVTLAVCPSTGTNYGREVLQGIADFVREREKLDMLRVTERDLLGAELWRSERVDGVIVYNPDLELTRRLRRARVPVINVSGKAEQSPFPRVISDDAAVGRLAARHLLTQGHRHFAYCGYETVAYSHVRHAGFSSVIAEAGYPVSARIFSRTNYGGRLPPHEAAAAIAWLQSLPRPVAIFATHDQLAVEVIELCLRAELRIPEEAAILGVGNDEVDIALSRVPLSTVVLGTRQIGWHAASLACDLIQKAPPPRLARLVPPLRVLARKSTDRLATDDPIVAASLQWLREHFTEAISVPDILSVVHVSRRDLERRFWRAVRSSPYAELVSLRMERAKELLLTTTIKLEHVAELSGFSDARHLSVAFHERLQITPGAYRRLNTVGEVSPAAAGG